MRDIVENIFPNSYGFKEHSRGFTFYMWDGIAFTDLNKLKEATNAKEILITSRLDRDGEPEASISVELG